MYPRRAYTALSNSRRSDSKRVEQLVASRYRLTEQLGAGSHRVVWRAVNEELDRPVALEHPDD